MSENSEFEAKPGEKGHVSTPNPALEGEGPGQYAEGDYGDAGVVDDVSEGTAEGEYQDGDYGDGGTVDPSGLTEGLARDAEGDETVPGRGDDDTEGRPRRD
jgi:hypothetical protein